MDRPFSAFVNSASPWLTGAFLVGYCMASRYGAAAAGVATCALQLVGYYITADLRGFPAGHGIIAFWGLCALIGGPLFGAAAHLWRTGPPSIRGLGAVAVPTAFLAEGLWAYGYTLHYSSTAALWIGIGLVLMLVVPRGIAQTRWVVLTLPAALAAEALLTHIYNQSF